MTINWPWVNDKSTQDQRFLQLVYEVARLTQRVEALEQQAAAHGQAQSDMRGTLAEVATVLKRWDGE